MEEERTDKHKERQAGKVVLRRKCKELRVNTRMLQDQTFQKKELIKTLTAKNNALARQPATIAAACKAARALEVVECKSKLKKRAAFVAACVTAKADGEADWALYDKHYSDIVKETGPACPLIQTPLPADEEPSRELQSPAADTVQIVPIACKKRKAASGF